MCVYIHTHTYIYIYIYICRHIELIHVIYICYRGALASVSVGAPGLRGIGPTRYTSNINFKIGKRAITPAAVVVLLT